MLFFADVEAVDFSRSQEAAEIINRWCANATKNHIKNIVAPGLFSLDLNSNCKYSVHLFMYYFDLSTDDVARSVIMLINTIYFNGYWSKPFAENQTTTENFYVNSTSYVPVPFMTKSDNFNYAESIELNAKLLRLPYKVKFSITSYYLHICINVLYCFFRREISLQCTLFCQTKTMDWMNLSRELILRIFIAYNS